MLADEVQAGFPAGVALPDSIRCICEFADAHGYPISGCFEINTRGDDAAAWFPNDLAMQRQIAVFGNGSTGSTYALWLTHQPDPAQAPVVVFGSEGEFQVLAESATEFCQLLACGFNELEWDDLTAAPECRDETQPFRDWVAERLGVARLADPAQAVQAAKARYPEFAEWVNCWQRDNL